MFHQKCILFHSFDVSYETAETSCRSLNNPSSHFTFKLITIESLEEQEFIHSLLLERDASSFKAENKKQTASYFWLDAKDVNRRNALETSLSSLPPVGCPSNPEGCPVKVVSSRDDFVWCYFDCQKSSVHVICESKPKLVTNTTEDSFDKNTVSEKNREDEEKKRLQIQSNSEIPDLNSSLSDNNKTNDSEDINVKVVSDNNNVVNEGDDDFGELHTKKEMTSTSTPSSTKAFSGDDRSKKHGNEDLHLKESTTIVINKKRDITDQTSIRPDKRPRYKVIPTIQYDCDVGWKLKDKKCFKISPTLSSGDESSPTCRMQYSAQAASITSRDQQEMLEELMKEHLESIQKPLLLLNSRRVGSEQRFKWESGEAFNFANWAAEQPSNYKDGNCLGVITNGVEFGQWKVVSCETSGNVICSKPAKFLSTFDSGLAKEVLEDDEDSSTTSSVEREAENTSPKDSQHPIHYEKDPEDESVVETDNHSMEGQKDTSQPKTNTSTSLILCLFIVALVAVMLLLCFLLGVKKRRNREQQRNRRSSKGSGHQVSPGAIQANATATNVSNKRKEQENEDGPIFLAKSTDDPSLYIDSRSNDRKSQNEEAPDASLLP